MTLLSTILTILFTSAVTFALSVYGGNILLHHLQYRNWLRQQRFSLATSNINEIIKLNEEIAELSSKRLWRMRKVVFALNDTNKERLDDALREYSEIKTVWNEKLSSFNARLTLYVSYKKSVELENHIQTKFYEANLVINTYVKDSKKIGDKKAYALLSDLNLIQGHLTLWNKNLLYSIIEKQEKTYLGQPIFLSKSNMQLFSNWELFKALFMPECKREGILRSPADFNKPPASGV